MSCYDEALHPSEPSAPFASLLDRADAVSQPAMFAEPVWLSRLLTVLEHARGARLTLLLAPAGVGKSALLHAWRRTTAHPLAWLAVTEHQAQLAGFLNGLVTAVQDRYPGFDRAVLNYLPPRALPPTWVIVDALVRALADLPGSLVIVLDNYHLVDDPAVQAVMVRLLEQLPEHVQLVLASRTEPPLHLGRWRAQEQLLELRGA